MNTKITMKQRMQYIGYRLRYELESPIYKGYNLADILGFITMFCLITLFTYICLFV